MERSGINYSSSFKDKTIDFRTISKKKLEMENVLFNFKLSYGARWEITVSIHKLSLATQAVFL